MRKILVCSANRAERGLLEPIVEELKKRKDVEVKWHKVEQSNVQSMITSFEMDLVGFQPDIILAPTDRWEMVYLAAYVFHKNIIVAHFHAGDVGEGTSDESNRFAISWMSHIYFCNSEESRQNLLKMGFEPWRIHVVGSTALDHIEIDESLCPKEPYDLVLLHPDPVSAEATKEDFHTLAKIIGATPAIHRIVWLAPNHDNNYSLIMDPMKLMSGAKGFTLIFEDLPRPQFLGLLKNCTRAIGNSSAFTLELPLVNPKAEYVQIGHRNANRNPPSKGLNASAKIAEVLATVPIDDKLRRKRIIL